MKRNNFTAMLLATLLLAGCGANTSSSTSSSAKDSTPKPTPTGENTASSGTLVSTSSSVDVNVPGPNGKTIDLTYSGTASDQTFNEGLFAEFKKARRAAGDPNVYNIAYEAHGPDAVDSEVVNWGEGPDVYEFASDKIVGLYQKGALARIGGKYRTFIEEEMNGFGQGAATFNGDFYAYPYTGDNTYYLQYDKSKLSLEDISSVENLLAKAESIGGKFGYNLETAFWGGGAMFTYGADYSMTFDDDGNVLSVEADFDTEKGIKAAKAIHKIVTHPAWQNASEAPNDTNGLVACIAGTWEIAGYREALGENYGCAVMPTVTIDGDTKNLGAFLGGKLFGVNPLRSAGDEDRLVAAHELAMFLSGKDAQLARFENAGVAPCHAEAAANEAVQANENVAVLAAHGSYAHAQTAVPGEFWKAPTNLVATLKSADFGGTDAEFATICKTFNDSVKASK